MTSLGGIGKRLVRVAAWGSVYLVFVQCVDDQVTTPTRRPDLVVRGWDTITGPGCPSEVIKTTTATTETILVTFNVSWLPEQTSCRPNLVEWGIDLSDPMAVDTPQGNGYFAVSDGFAAANMPSPPNVAYGAFYSAPQVMIEFDPPVRKVEFYYSRLRGQSAIWPGAPGGPIYASDSMMVWAVSRFPGTLSYWYWDSEKIWSNVPSFSPPWSVWTAVTLQTGGGDGIQWLWFDGSIVIDDLKITRAKQDSTFHIVTTGCPTTVTRASTMTCTATWAPSNIPASEILFEWHFQGDSVRVFPAANATPYHPPPPVDSAGQGLASWTGKLVLGGRVTLQATWQGDLDRDSTNVAIIARTAGFGNLPVRLKPDTVDLATNLGTWLVLQGDLTVEPIELGIVAENFDSALGTSAFRDAIFRRPKLAQVPLGPNRGYWFVDSAQVELLRRIRIRTWVTGRTQALFSYSPVPGLLTNRGILNAKRKSGNKRQYPDSLELLAGLWGHEGFGRGSGKGHQGRFQVAAASLPTCGKAPTILERVVGPDSAETRRMTNEVIEEGWKSLGAASGHFYVHSNYANAPYYEVVSQVTSADNLLAKYWPRDTAYTQVSSAMAPDPRWNCSRTY